MERRSGWIGLVVLALAGGTAVGRPAEVHPAVLEAVAEGPAEFLVVLPDQADLSAAAGFATKEARGRFVVDTLRRRARRSQGALLEFLRKRGAEHRPLWIANFLWVRGDAALVDQLAARGDVLRIDPNPNVRTALPRPDAPIGPRATTAIEWNVQQVNADQVWSLGYLGRGAVIAGQDTGYQWDHPALVESYRGWDGVSASHDYNWHDAIHAGGGICGADSAEPCDDQGHGTHTMGTMVGDDGGVNRIGIAPGARWIGCRNMDQGIGTPLTYAECFQWLVAPTDRNGANPDPAMAPDVINNSWLCPPFEGCSADTLRTVVENTRAAGIVVVSSAGNSGSSCSTVSHPPAIYDASFSVGATDPFDEVATFSSRGPVIADGSNRLKPDVSAPGVAVRSSVPLDGYSSFSGTSMAGPHAAGLVALLLEARPDLRGRVEEIEGLLRLSTVPRTTTQDCGQIPGTSVPNHTYGHGRIDALQLLQADADADGTANLSDCAPVDAATWAVPSPAVGLRLDRRSGATLTWQPPVEPGALVPLYDVLRSVRADDFSQAACLASGAAETELADPEPPPAIFFYLVRVQNACGANPGNGSSGAPRLVAACP